MKAANSPWHETLSQALDAGIAELKARGADLKDEQELRDAFAFGGMVYNETKSANAPLNSYKGKGTKKAAHLTIYRSESGRYEQTNYIL